jgi:hypothetical protein
VRAGRTTAKEVGNLYAEGGGEVFENVDGRIRGTPLDLADVLIAPTRPFRDGLPGSSAGRVESA